MGYKYLIKPTDKNHLFGLYPNNSNSQPLGISKEYKSITEAENGIKNLKNIINNNLLKFNIFERQNKYYFELNDMNGNVLFYREKSYERKDECKKGVQRVIKNISAPIGK